jgi:formiminoglutamase
MYEKPVMTLWQGRVDSEKDENYFLIHQKVEELNSPYTGKERGVVMLGFACDEGVRRNKGRTGAKKGPYELKKMLGKHTYHWAGLPLYDGGYVVCNDNELEKSQKELSIEVHNILQYGHFPIIFGGGHEVAYGNFSGLLNYYSKVMDNPKIGIINFDAHFDLRDYKHFSHSGSSFLQIADLCQKENREFYYLCIGVSKTSNSKALFNTANKLSVKYILDEDICIYKSEFLERNITEFVEKTNIIYITLDLDVLPCYIAPGVSAPAGRGISVEVLNYILNFLFSNFSDKIKIIDMAEYAPSYDINDNTARVSTRLIFSIIDKLYPTFKKDINR